MKFAVKAWGNGKARTGFLQLVHCASAMETPALLLSTRKGLPNFSSPDLLPSLPSPDSHLLQFSPLHLGICHRKGRLLAMDVERVIMEGSSFDIWASLADEVPSWVSDKRNKTSVDRTVKWLDECITMNSTGGAVFGAIVGGNDVEERQRCAAEVVKRYVSGYWIGGFGLGESTDERPALLDAITDVLPEEMPRMICGLGLPDITLIII
ncbi:Queuine tRNA-ribosyltransferase accessory subunit 2, partial [Cucurbita argyrosperma subsp. sororia]